MIFTKTSTLTKAPITKEYCVVQNFDGEVWNLAFDIWKIGTGKLCTGENFKWFRIQQIIAKKSSLNQCSQSKFYTTLVSSCCYNHACGW